MPNLVDKTCENCKVKFTVPFKQRQRRFCCRKCVDESHTGEGNPAFGKSYRTKATHPDWARNIREGSKGINSGDSNAMKRPEVRLKMSQSRSAMLADEGVRNKIAEATRKAWADGKFDGVRVGQCKWYDHIKPDGSIVKLQGTWELAFAKWADQTNLEYTAHRGRINYVLDGKKHSYYPDFYVEQWQCWVEIKNEYHYSIQKNKFDTLLKDGVNVKILMKKDLLSLGVTI